MEKIIRYPAIEPKQHIGNEQFMDAEGYPLSSLLEFWRWAYSDLIGNTGRGMIAEYLVACALGISKEPRISWGSYDLKSREGIRIEVKTSGYIQTWGQEELSKISFGIQKTHGLDNETNKSDSELKRQADVYIFCVHKHTDQDTINPLDVLQWDFYILLTKVLDKECGNQKTISLKGIKKIGAVKCEYEQLYEKVVAAFDSQ